MAMIRRSTECPGKRVRGWGWPEMNSGEVSMWLVLREAATGGMNAERNFGIFGLLSSEERRMQ